MGAAGTGFPLNPPNYVAGTITLADSTPRQLLALIQAQLDARCAGAGRQVTIQADDSGTLYIGTETPLGGALSTTNYGYACGVSGGSNTYRTSFPGASAPVGDIMVLMDGGGTFHVEVSQG